jgi:ceroid-lipofuscinosis MFS transporter 7
MSAQEKVQGATLKKRKASTNLDVFASLEDSLETPQEKKVRLRSIFVVHFSLLVASLGSSIIFTGVYPYLIQMDPSVAMIEYGIVVAADAAAQMIFAPLFGAWVDRIKTVRPVFLICCTLFCAGNVLYAMVGMFHRNHIFGVEIRGSRIWVMLVARFVVGAGTALNSAGRYYITQATLVSERTTQISILSLFQTLGFIMGPGIQVRSQDTDHKILLTNPRRASPHLGLAR